MKPIKYYKMSLMNKEGLDEEQKMQYIVKCSANLNVQKYLESNPIKKDITYEDFIYASAELIFKELSTQTKDPESIGLWITFEDDSVIENSIDLSVLKDIEQYGDEGIEPITEFFKMTLEI